METSTFGQYVEIKLPYLGAAVIVCPTPTVASVIVWKVPYLGAAVIVWNFHIWALPLTAHLYTDVQRPELTQQRE